MTDQTADQLADQLADLLAGLPLAALLIAPDARITGANEAALALLGRGIVGRHHSFALRQPEVLQAIARAIASKKQSTVRQVLPGPSHEIVHRITISAFGQGAMCLFQDISEQEQAEQMRRDFVANVSHELRTPLTSLLGFIETLRGPARQDAAARDRFLATMASEAGRMNRLVQDLLHLSRVEAQERQRPATRHDLAALIRLALQGLRPLAEATGVDLQPSGLDREEMILVDPDQMMQVVTNLSRTPSNTVGRASRFRSACRVRPARAAPWCGLRSPITARALIPCTSRVWPSVSTASTATAAAKRVAPGWGWPS